MQNLSGMISTTPYPIFAGQKKVAVKERAAEVASSISHRQENQIEERKGSSNRSNSKLEICPKQYTKLLIWLKLSYSLHKEQLMTQN